MASINDEWLRKPMSELEKTLRLPHLIRAFVLLFFTRTLLLWLGFGFVVWYIFSNLYLIFVIGFFITLIYEMFSLYGWHKRRVMPIHIKNISVIKNLYIKSKTSSKLDLVNYIEVAVEKSAWNMVHSGYLILPSWGWEILFKVIYPFLVSDKQTPYQYLLVGFNNKTVESDQKLWEVSQEMDHSIQKKLLEQWSDEFGSRVEDIDLAYPTLRERPKAIESLLALLRLSKSPKSLMDIAKNKREQSLKQISKHLRVPFPVFNWLLLIVQKNVSLREDRRYFEFQADYYLRQMLFNLADQLSIPNDTIFNMTWREIKNATNR